MRIEKVCREKEAETNRSKDRRERPVRYIDERDAEVEPGIFNIRTGNPPILVPIMIDGEDVTLEPWLMRDA